MKRSVLFVLAAAGIMNASAQVVKDSVLLGASYANQVWYSLADDEKGSAPKTNWDIAFDLKGIQSSVHINSVAGVTLWAYPKAAISGWATVDTTGLSTWPPRYNSDTSWTFGAMGNYGNPSDPTDLDWGKYDMTTHIVTGDSLFIIKLPNGNYKKLAILGLSSGTFNFKYADLNGSNEKTPSVAKGSFADKNFAYYSLQTDAALPATREPNYNTWDLLFTQYTAFIPSAYTVTGVLHNRGVRIAKVSNLPSKETYKDYSTQTFTSAINTLGYNWKTFNMSTSSYVIKDSTVFFVKSLTGDIWKVIMTGFASADGKSVFTKEKLTTVGIGNISKTNASMSIYPNPAVSAQNVTVVYNFENAVNSARIVVRDMTGKIVMADNAETAIGLHQYTLQPTLSAGTYVLSVETDNGRMVQKLIIQ